MDFEIWSRTQEYQNTSEIQPIQLSHLYDHWVRAKNSAEVPKQRDFSIDAVKEFAGHLALVDLEANPKCARYVLVGKNLKRLLGKDPTNMAIEDVYPPDTSKDIYDAFSKTVHERTATFYQRSYVVLGKQFGYYRLILPLRLNSDVVRRLLIGIYPTDYKMTDASGWQKAVDKLLHRKQGFEDMHPRKLGKVWESSLNR